MKKTTLDKIPLNCEVYIDSIECGNGIKNRIFDMGITEGCLLYTSDAADDL